MPRFVILDHDHPEPHFDLMIESAGRLRTWRLLGDPQSQHPIPAEPIGDHRMEYLEYEGPLGGDRGRVVRWDSGSGEVIEKSVVWIVVELHGSRCRGRGELRQSNGGWTWRWTQFRD
jgi:hypothetical protein